jgi:hypothetical protein
MSDPLRTDSPREPHLSTEAERDAKIEQLLLAGLDHYFAGQYEHAINVWTRALFLDRSHARARAYIERARSALAERQRESEELLQNGVAAFERGEGDDARRLLHAAIDGGAPSEEALAVLDRLNRLEAAAAPAATPSSIPSRRDRVQRLADRPAGSPRRLPASAIAIAIAATVIVVAGLAAGQDLIDWRSLAASTRATAPAEPAPTALSAPLPRDAALPLPRRGETALLHARALSTGGHLRDALTALDEVRPTDPQRAEADRLKGDIQRQLLALTPVPSGNAPDREKGERRNP